MSAYQYYEFQAIDRPLSADQQARVATLSSRAHVTAHMTMFVYNYGDFRGDPEQLLRDYFDAMLYMANWGARSGEPCYPRESPVLGAQAEFFPDAQHWGLAISFSNTAMTSSRHTSYEGTRLDGSPRCL